jgi:glycine/D-amino acid oxidase-like deaminating enzyme
MAFGSSVLSSNASFDPYWWRAAPHEDRIASMPPQRTDVAIVGSGITGLVAALHLARGGRQVTIFEAREPGHGASSRNAGYVGRTLKHGFGEIMEAQGLGQAKRIYGELMEAFLRAASAVLFGPNFLEHHEHLDIAPLSRVSEG